MGEVTLACCSYPETPLLLTIPPHKRDSRWCERLLHDYSSANRYHATQIVRKHTRRCSAFLRADTTPPGSAVAGSRVHEPQGLNAAVRAGSGRWQMQGVRMGPVPPTPVPWPPCIASAWHPCDAFDVLRMCRGSRLWHATWHAKDACNVACERRQANTAQFAWHGGAEVRTLAGSDEGRVVPPRAHGRERGAAALRSLG